MARRYLVLSDLHLADIEDHLDGWKVHKHSKMVFDEALDQAVTGFVEAADPGDTTIVVLNGDIFDFDLVSAIPSDPPWPVSARERVRGLAPTEAKSAWKMARILEHRPRFVTMLARLIGQGHEVVHVAGNHDTEVHFGDVRKALVDAVTTRALAVGYDPDPTRIRFERWFYYVPGEIYVEHGHQYDDYSSFRSPLDPVDHSTSPPEIKLSMGNVSNRTLLGRMGFFNPHASDYMLSGGAYIAHWLRHYAFTRRNLLSVWLFGSFVLAWELLTGQERMRTPSAQEGLHDLAIRSGLPLATLRKLDRLKRPPVATQAFKLCRELWLDRLLLTTLMVGATITLALMPIPLWIQLMVPLCAFPLLYLLYEGLVADDGIYGMERQAREYATQIATILDTPVVTFGHSHVPEQLPILPGVWYANTGTWAPILESRDGALKAGLRNALQVVVDGDRVRVRLETHQAVGPDKVVAAPPIAVPNASVASAGPARPVESVDLVM
ncbi:MAG: UDP-2,3-diacylglucosamine pyrophosphatase LpxH [Myxococcota bacterium]|jgi:UDP-2,3-diacylglucosamine pyrophosphatase LpxH